MHITSWPDGWYYLICSMSAVGSSASNATMEGFFGLLKHELVNR